MHIKCNNLVMYTLKTRKKQALFSSYSSVVVKVQVQPGNVGYSCSSSWLCLISFHVLPSRLRGHPQIHVV